MKTENVSLWLRKELSDLLHMNRWSVMSLPVVPLPDCANWVHNSLLRLFTSFLPSVHVKQPRICFGAWKFSTRLMQVHMLRFLLSVLLVLGINQTYSTHDVASVLAVLLDFTLTNLAQFGVAD